MGSPRTFAAGALLAVEAALAALVVTVHHGLTAEYGDVSDSALEAVTGAFTAGIGWIALGLVGLAALLAASVASRRWMRRTAVAVPVLMLLGMAAVTPSALRHKLDVQYDARPGCVLAEDPTTGPGARAALESQRAFDSIEHVGHFGGGGSSGVGGCDRTFVLTRDADVLGHYRQALPGAGWRVVADDGRLVRAERGDMAFEVVECGRGGAVWAGDRRASPRGPRCDGAAHVGAGRLVTSTPGASRAGRRSRAAGARTPPARCRRR